MHKHIRDVYTHISVANVRITRLLNVSKPLKVLLW